MSANAVLESQKKAATTNTPGMPSIVQEVVRSPGQPLDAATRASMELRFGHDFRNVRIHADAKAEESARTVNALAYTVGRNVAFAAGQYSPGNPAGQRLLMHELSHVVQQCGHDSSPIMPHDVGGLTEPAELEAHAIAERATSLPSPVSVHTVAAAGLIQRQQVVAQPKAQPQVQLAPPQVQPATVQDAIEFLQEMASFMQRIRLEAEEKWWAVPPFPLFASYGGRVHVWRMVEQTRIASFLQAARDTYKTQFLQLPKNEPQLTVLREAYVRALGEIRLAMDQSLAYASALDETRIYAPERGLYAENLARWIEASPMTVTRLASAAPFQQAEVAAAVNYEREIEAYLDSLLVNLPSLRLNAEKQNEIYERILAVLRRAFVTVGTGPTGTIDVRAITNPVIVDKLRRVTAVLRGGLTNPAQMSIITEELPAYKLPEPITDPSPQFGARRVDLTRVPADELAAVRWGVWQAITAQFEPPGTVELRNAYWPVSLLVQRGGNVTSVRYELVFDGDGNVRVERLGEAQPREVAPDFAQLTVAEKRNRLVADFGLAAINNRPPAHKRPVAVWSGPELDQVKAAFDLIPERDRAALKGVTLVRDHRGPPQPGGRILGGYFHSGPDRAHDQPGPQGHGPPHIHYYDAAFAENQFGVVGAPGAAGPGGDWTLLHEVGHAWTEVATLQANRSIMLANQQRTRRNRQLASSIRGVQISTDQRNAWMTWQNHMLAANQAILDFNRSLTVMPLQGATQQAALQEAARLAIQTRDTSRQGLANAGLPEAVVTAATNLDAANDALFAAVSQLAAAQDQIPIFVSLAERFGFWRFTNYARRGADQEWFAETYALYLNDPNRLNEMSRNLFLWFQAGMPMDRNWTP